MNFDSRFDLFFDKVEKNLNKKLKPLKNLIQTNDKSIAEVAYTDESILTRLENQDPTKELLVIKKFCP